jgi:hypothetical protein
MFDESYCAGMALGPPQVSIDGLNEFAVVLKLSRSPSFALFARFVRLPSDATDFGIDCLDAVEAGFDLLPDHLQLLRLQRASV